jgi:uncharacterized repeat protein (TIGR01451 family)
MELRHFFTAKRLLRVLIILPLLFASFPTGFSPAQAVSTGLVISQVYGGSGNTGAIYTNDFIELFNLGTSGVNITGWSVQSWSILSHTWSRTNLPAVTIPAGGYYLIQEWAGNGGGLPLPNPDVTEGTMDVGNSTGEIALVSNQTTLTCDTTGVADCLSDPASLGIVDFLGYGPSALSYEGAAPANGTGSTVSAFRTGEGCLDTDENLPDFYNFTPAPRNSTTPTHTCAAPGAPVVLYTDPADLATGIPADSNYRVVFDQPVSVVAGSPNWVTMTCTVSDGHYVSTGEGPTGYLLYPEQPVGNPILPGETCTLTVNHLKVSATLSPFSPMAADYAWSFTIKNDPPTVDAGGPYSAVGTQTVQLTASGTDPEGYPLTYAWDFDNDTLFDDATGAVVDYVAADVSTPTPVTVKVKVTDNGGLTAEDTATVNIDPLNPSLNLEKTADPTSYTAVDEVIDYSYVLTNSGNVTLVAPFTVTDDKATVTCPPNPTSLAPTESIPCNASYTITQADMDAGFVTNKATGHGKYGVTTVNSNEATATVTTTRSPALTLVKTADPTIFDKIGDVIDYRYELTNSGNVTLIGPFTITDDKATDEACPDTPASLAPDDSTICTASYTITQADLDAGFVTNKATGHGFDGTTPVNSNEATQTVTTTQMGALTLVKTANPTTYDHAGQIIAYSYEVTNSGPVTLHNAITVSDDKVTVTCDALPAGGLAPGAKITCTASYTIKQADLYAGSVTNKATAATTFGGNPVVSNEATFTIITHIKFTFLPLIFR